MRIRIFPLFNALCEAAVPEEAVDRVRIIGADQTQMFRADRLLGGTTICSPSYITARTGRGSARYRNRRLCGAVRYSRMRMVREDRREQ